MPHALQFLLLTAAGWVNRHHSPAWRAGAQTTPDDGHEPLLELPHIHEHIEDLEVFALQTLLSPSESLLPHLSYSVCDEHTENCATEP